MAPRSLPKAQWRQYFDRLSKHLPATYAEISVEGLDLGDQILTSKALLKGITYEPPSNMVTLLLEGLDHNIEGVEVVWVDDEPAGLRSVAFLDADGHEQIVVFHSALELPPA